MIGDIGRAAALISFVFAVYATVVCFWAGRSRRGDLLESGRRAVLGTFAMVWTAAGCLILSLLMKDYSLRFVANYTSNDAPWNYAATAFWAGNAGSMLLWVSVLTLCTVLVMAQTRTAHPDLSPYILGVLSGIAVFFLVMLNFADSPFVKLDFVPADGRGLNPLLENFWMQIHPPTLYMGYITFSVPFAIAAAALLSNRLGDEWIRFVRGWSLVAWSFLGLGNLLGAKWAYETLGWGGYWGWDPVENAAIMPWFTGTAFLHSIMIQERRGMLKVWNLALIAITFCLTIFGTFLVRSGIISSVHAFGVSELGPYFFGFLAFIIVASILVIGIRLPGLRSENQLDSLLSRESSFLVNNLLLVGCSFAIFWGTVYPLISEATRDVKITVGAPYYDQVVGPILLGVFLLMGIGPLIAWRRATVANLMRNFRGPIAVGALTLAGVAAVGWRETPTLLAAPVLGFVFAGMVQEFYRGTRARMRGNGEAPWTAFGQLFRRNRQRYGGYVVHVGMIVIAVGVIGSKVYQTSSEATLKPGESAKVGSYTVTNLRLDQSATRTRESNRVTLGIAQNGRDVGTLVAEKNFFIVQQQPQSVVGLRSTLLDDLYTVMQAHQGDGTVTLTMYVNPLVAWIWIGGGVFLVGCFVCFAPERSRASASRRAPALGDLAGARA